MAKLCENPTTRWLREKFHAFPVEIPEERYQPMVLIQKKGKELNYLGNFNQIVHNGHLDISVEHSRMSDASLNRTKSLDISGGLGLLSGFFKSMQMDPAALSAAFKKVKEVSLSFSEVMRNYVEILAVGKAWNEVEIDLENPVLQLLKRDKKLKLLLLTDAITSKDFTIVEHKNSSVGFHIDVPLIEKYISDSNLKVGIDTDKKSSVTFKAENPLTFAIACAQLGFHEQTGKLQIEQVNISKAANAEPQELDFRVILDEDEWEPELLVIR